MQNFKHQKFHTVYEYFSINIGTVRPRFSGRRRAAQGRRIIKNSGRRIIKNSGRRIIKNSRLRTLKIQGGASSLTYVIIICMKSHGRNQEE